MRNSLPILKLQTNDMVLSVDNQGIRQIGVIVSLIVPSLINNKFWQTQRFIEKWIISAAKTLNPLDGCNYQNKG